jgi:hypothetical protein
MDGEEIEQVGGGKHLEHPPLWCGQQQVTPGVPGVFPRAHEGRQAAGVNKFQARQVHDDPRLADGDRCERTRDARGIKYVKLAAQRDNDMTIAFAGTKVHAEHRPALLLKRQGGVWTQRLITMTIR